MLGTLPQCLIRPTWSTGHSKIIRILLIITFSYTAMERLGYISADEKEIFVLSAFFGLSFFSPKQLVVSEDQPSYLWQVRSVDTMKTSRDKARVRLYDL